MLRLLKYYHLPESPLLPEIAERLSQVFEGRESLPIEIDPPLDVDELMRQQYQPSPKQVLPNRAHYENILSASFEKVRLRLGEKEPMRLLGEPWFVLGHTIFFASDAPSEAEVTAALKIWMQQQKG